ncbi:lateral organ boundaries domain-containing protein [Cynara cardunculus var. scolymus]|uniref:Lateral organ boundaries domain-containing protein n=1 Tax=Cynara cardunculus var. scolymus TaxID=59895 RepID=A0A103XIC6_CYNCS|nr:lateral organ boundaries domain-containing protein [Cynara cardunculus var. scolymus]
MGGNGGGGGGGSPCGACKFLRRKCVKGCVFAPYFKSDDGGTAEFEAVHRVFGARNAAKLLLITPANRRLDAVVSLCYEAVSRVKDPVTSCQSSKNHSPSSFGSTVPSLETPGFSNDDSASLDEALFKDIDGLEMLARELLNKYLPGSKI